MPVARLREQCASATHHHPDIVVLTGDFFTVEALEEPTALVEALGPLVAALPGRVFACLGNHDKESVAIGRVIRGGTISWSTLPVEVEKKKRRWGTGDSFLRIISYLLLFFRCCFLGAGN